MVLCCCSQVSDKLQFILQHKRLLSWKKYTCWPFLICSISGQFNGSYSAASKQINGTALQCFQNRDVRITLLARSKRLAICFHQWCAAATSSVQVGIKATFLCCFVPRIKYAEMYCHWIWRFDLESITQLSCMKHTSLLSHDVTVTVQSHTLIRQAQVPWVNCWC